MKTESKIKARVELTDTFGGEPNYSWVELLELEANTTLGIVRAAKRELGLVGVRCVREDWCDSIVLRPVGMNLIVFIDIEW